MKELERIDTLERAAALLHPLRLRILARAAEPVSAVELGRELGLKPQNVNYHLKELERAGLLRKVREERKRNLTKAYYQAKDQVSLYRLLGLARELEGDVIATLNRAQRGREGPASLGVKADLAFPTGEARRAFMQDYTAMLDELVKRYGAGAEAAPESAPETATRSAPGSRLCEPEERYTAMLAVYPAGARDRAGGGGHGGSEAQEGGDGEGEGPGARNAAWGAARDSGPGREVRPDPAGGAGRSGATAGGEGRSGAPGEGGDDPADRRAGARRRGKGGRRGGPGPRG